MFAMCEQARISGCHTKTQIDPSKDATSRRAEGSAERNKQRKGRRHDREMTSPYLEQPFVPLAVALPQTLESIEAELANEQLDLAQKSRLRRRAELIRGLLAPSQIT